MLRTRPRSKITRSATSGSSSSYTRRMPVTASTSRRGRVGQQLGAAAPLRHLEQQLGGLAARPGVVQALARARRSRAARAPPAARCAHRLAHLQARHQRREQRRVAEPDAVVLQPDRVERAAEHGQRLGGALAARASRSARCPPAAARAAARAAGARRDSSARSSRSAAAARWPRSAWRRRARSARSCPSAAPARRRSRRTRGRPAALRPCRRARAPTRTRAPACRSRRSRARSKTARSVSVIARTSPVSCREHVARAAGDWVDHADPRLRSWLGRYA